MSRSGFFGSLRRLGGKLPPRPLLLLLLLLPACTQGEFEATHPDGLADNPVLDRSSPDLDPWPAPWRRVWQASDTTAVFSSPRVADLDGDGVLDIISGHGVEVDETGVPVGYATATSGADGHELWRISAREELVGSAVVLHIDDDATLDVVIGGRNAELIAISGATGELLWSFYPDGGARADGWLNFYTPQVIPDVNGDGFDDLLAPNGGDAKAQRYEPQPAGRLVTLSGRDGSILNVATVTDDQPTYMSPLVYRPRPDADLVVLYGTGGETLPGSLWQVPLSDVIQGDLSRTRRILDGEDKGFIAPPSLADLTQDGTLDIVVNTFEGRIIALDGASFAPLWEVPFTGAETYASPVLGQFTDDDIPDVFSGFSIGMWPTYRKTQQTLVDGATGEVLWRGETPDWFLSSPLAVDLNGDGRHEILWASFAPYGASQLIIFDPIALKPWRLDYIFGGGLSSSWLGDLDNDGLLDLVVSYTDIEPSWHLDRYDLQLAAPDVIPWGAYLGTDLNGVFLE